MKKLALVLVLVASGFINAQVENYRFVNYSYTRHQQKLLKENNFTSWCNPHIRDAYETNNFDYLNSFDFSAEELLKFNKSYKNFVKVHGKTVQPVRDLTPIMSFNEYLDNKVNYDPIINIARGDRQITAIVPIKSIIPRYLALELVQMIFICHEEKCVIITTTIFGQLPDGMWVVCNDYMFDETLEAPQACVW